MQRIVINICYGGFGLSEEAEARYKEITGKDFPLYSWDIKRDDPALIQTIKELGDKANNRYSELRIVEIPDGVQWQIEEYDGNEWVAEQHRTWR